jgi:hypothetical protein
MHETRCAGAQRCDQDRRSVPHGGIPITSSFRRSFDQPANSTWGLSADRNRHKALLAVTDTGSLARQRASVQAANRQMTGRIGSDRLWTASQPMVTWRKVAAEPQPRNRDRRRGNMRPAGRSRTHPGSGIWERWSYTGHGAPDSTGGYPVTRQNTRQLHRQPSEGLPAVCERLVVTAVLSVLPADRLERPCLARNRHRRSGTGQAPAVPRRTPRRGDSGVHPPVRGSGGCVLDRRSHPARRIARSPPNVDRSGIVEAQPGAGATEALAPVRLCRWRGR